MVSGYESMFTATGAEIAEETQRINQDLGSLCVSSAISAPVAVNMLYSLASCKH